MLQAKHQQTGEDSWRLLGWLEPLLLEVREGPQVRLLKEVFAQQYVVIESAKVEALQVHAPGVVQNPHDPQAQWSAKGRGAAKKEWVGYKVQVAESFTEAIPQTEEAPPPPPQAEDKAQPRANFLTS